MAPILVGRADELAAFDEAWRQLHSGRGEFICVIGEPGIGKTSLLSALADALGAGEVQLGVACADETDRRRDLSLVRALLPGVNVGQGVNPIDATLAELERVAGDGPVALLADDVHWADDSSLTALRAIGRQAVNLGVLVTVTLRPQPTTAVLQRLVELAETHGRCLRPTPLDDQELATLIARRVGAAPGPRLCTLLASTAGNPFLAAELVDSLVEAHQVAVDDGIADVADDVQLPGGLSQRLAGRALAAVPDGDLLIRAVAAVPGGATAEELATLLDLPLSRVLANALAAVDACVLVDTGATLAFRHDLLRRSVIDATPRSIVGTLSRRAGQVLHERRADPARVTACLLDSSDPDDPSHVDQLLHLARRYRETHPSAAADLFARSLDGIAPVDSRHVGVVVELGFALIDAGRATEVEPWLAEQLGPPNDAESTDVQRLRGIAASLTGRVDRVAERYAAVDVAHLDRWYDRDDPDAVDAVAELGLLKVASARLADAETIADWVDSSPPPSSPFRAATVQTVRAWIAATAGRFEDAITCSRAALGWTAQDTTRRASAATPTLTLAVSLDQVGDSEAALAYSRGRTAQLVLPRWGPPLLQFFAALVLYRRGDWDDALAEADAGLQAADDVDLAMAVFWPFAVQALVAVFRGDLAGARRLLTGVRRGSGAPQLGTEWLLYGSALLADAGGDRRAAIELVESAVHGVEAANAPALLLNGGPDMIGVCLEGGRPALGERIANTIRLLTSRTRSPVVAALSEWSDGLMSSDRTRVELAGSELLAAGRLPEAARAHHAASVLAAATGDVEVARLLSKQAFALYDTLGAEQSRRLLRSQLRIKGLDVRPRREPPRPTSGWASLTASEQTIVSLVGDGVTNTAIADRLYVSRRTVESHLVRVYTKLGLTTRAQLVAAVIANRTGATIRS